MPQSALEHAADERAKRRVKIKLDNLAEIEEERRGIIEMAPVRQMEQAQDELRIPHDEKGKWNLWNQLDDRLSAGGILNGQELLFYEAYRKSAGWRAFAEDVAGTLGKQQAA